MGLTYLQNSNWFPQANIKEKLPVRGIMGGKGRLHVGQGEEKVIMKYAQSILLNKSLPFQGDHETLR